MISPLPLRAMSRKGTYRVWVGERYELDLEALRRWVSVFGCMALDRLIMTAFIHSVESWVRLIRI